MSVFVDSGVFYAHQDPDAAEHEAAHHGLDLALSGRLGRALTSDYVFDEAVTLTRQRTHSHAHAITVARRILGTDPHPRVFDVLMVTGSVFRDAVGVLERYQDKQLSFTDATTIALVQRRRVDRVLSFDSDFDGIVPRLDPRDAGK